MPGGWLGLPAIRTIRLSAPRTGKDETSDHRAKDGEPDEAAEQV